MSELQYPVQDMNDDADLDRPALILARTPPVTDDLLVAPDGSLASRKAHPPPAPTGQVADKAFFDWLCGEEAWMRCARRPTWYGSTSVTSPAPHSVPISGAPPPAALQARHNLAQHLRSNPECHLNRCIVVHDNRRSIQTARFRIMDITAKRLLAYAYQPKSQGRRASLTSSHGYGRALHRPLKNPGG